MGPAEPSPRGPKRVAPSRGWRLLYASDKIRQYHPTVHTDDYNFNVLIRLSNATGNDGDCSQAGDRERFLEALQVIKERLKTGSFRIHGQDRQ